jgi:hypothetical protein
MLKKYVPLFWKEARKVEPEVTSARLVVLELIWPALVIRSAAVKLLPLRVIPESLVRPLVPDQMAKRLATPVPVTVPAGSSQVGTPPLIVKTCPADPAANAVRALELEL